MYNFKRIQSAIIALLVVIFCFATMYYINTAALTESINAVKTELSCAKAELTDTNVELEEARATNVALTEDLDIANGIIAVMQSEEYIVNMRVTTAEIDILAKTVWGEARGCNKFEQSAVVWCILNRVDAGRGTIAQVVTPGQFHGYNSSFPIDPEIKALVEDVVARWKLEKITDADVGRTLPKEYLYFSADGTGIGNIFRTTWTGPCEVWDWDCWNPYEE